LSLAGELKDQTQLVEAAAILASLLAAEGHGQSALELVIQVERYSVKVPAAQERASQLIAELAGSDLRGGLSAHRETEWGKVARRRAVRILPLVW
jgi:hypothetical protein